MGKPLTGKESIEKDTGLKCFAMIDPIFIALPLSIIVTLVVALIVKSKLENEHIDK